MPLLAKAKNRPQTREEIASLLLSIDSAADYLVQDHYTVEGSLQALISMVTHAYHKWRRAQTEECVCRWSYPLAIFDSTVVVYDYGNSGDCKYHSIPYTVSNGTVEFGEPTEVDVALVVRSLGEEEAAQSDPGTTAAVVTPDVDAEVPVVTPEVDSETLVEADEAIIQAAIDNPEYTILQGDPVEAEILEQKEVEQGGKKYRWLKIAVTQANVLNTQSQVYPKKVWENNFDRLNRLAQASKNYGQLEHPKSGESQRGGLTQSAIMWDKFYWDQDNPNLLIGEGKVIPTDPHGKNLIAILEAGGKVDASSRGFGTAKQGEWNGQDALIIDEDFVCVTFDIVQHGSSPGSNQISTFVQSPDHSKTEQRTNMNPEDTATTPAADATPATTPAPAAQAEPEATPAPAATPAPVVQSDPNAEARQWAQSQSDTALFASTRAALINAASLKLSEVGLASYQAALNRVPEGNLTQLKQTGEQWLPILLDSAPKVVQSAEPITGMPYSYVAKDQAELAPRNETELIDRIVRDLPDRWPGFKGQCDDPTIPNQKTLGSMREAARRIITNTAGTVYQGFNGPASIKALLALEQGRIEAAQSILQAGHLGQALPDGSTTTGGWADGGGAPTSNVYLFSMIRRVLPMLILGELAAIQPLDRPEGKIFFLDHYRTGDGGAASNTAYEKRIDLNTSSVPFNSSYAASAGEGAAIKQMRLRLTSQAVTAENKKLGAAWPIEEMQDLRAYHGLDASAELAFAMATEMAHEWNLEFLQMMLNGATGGSLTFGTTKPASGFTDQKDWDEYIWVYLNKLDNMVYSKRNGNISHLVVGIDAALALAKSQRGMFTIGEGARGSMEMYPGATFFGAFNQGPLAGVKVFKTNFMRTGSDDGSKILAIRRGNTWSETAAVYSPYATYITGVFTDPADLTQKQGLLDRAAMTMVVPDACAVLTIDDSTGVAL